MTEAQVTVARPKAGSAGKEISTLASRGAEPSLLSELLAASVGAALCGVAAVVLLRASVLDALWLTATCSLSLWLVLLAWGSLARDPAVRGPAAWGVASIAVFAYLLGSLLQDNTHHRPLAAVTWVLVTLGAAAGVATVLGRVVSWQRAGFVACALVLLGLVVLAARGTHAQHLQQWAVSALAVALAVYLRHKLSSIPSAVGLAAALVLVGSWGSLAWSGQAERLYEQAPLWLGFGALFK